MSLFNFIKAIIACLSIYSKLNYNSKYKLIKYINILLRDNINLLLAKSLLLILIIIFIFKLANIIKERKQVTTWQTQLLLKHSGLIFVTRMRVIKNEVPFALAAFFFDFLLNHTSSESAHSIFSSLSPHS